MSNQRPKLLNKRTALPSDHGSWVFLLSPLLIGWFAGGRWDRGHAWLILTLMAVFLLRQPAATLVKTLSGRRSKRDQPAALTWIGVFGVLAAIGLDRGSDEPDKSAFITNVIYWRPPGNRKPTENETLMCMPSQH